jgi:pimeloyl-ACP methyl ester carboxylesterase
MNDVAELKHYVSAHAASLGMPADHYQRLLASITDDGSWVAEWAAWGDSLEAAGKLLEASQHFNFARFPFVDGAARQAALERCVHAIDRWRQGIPGIERLDLDILGGRVGCWAGWLDDKQPRPLLLISGGIVSIKEQWAPVLLAARELGLSAVVTEMPSVGENTLRYTPESWEMIPAILDALRGRADVTQSYLMAMSYSGQAAFRAAPEDTRIRGIVTVGAPVLEAFSNAAWVRALPRVTTDTLAHMTGAAAGALPQLLPGWALSGSQLAAISVPVYYVASSRDEIIPPEDLRLLRRHVRNLDVLEHDDVHGAPAHAALTRQWMIDAVRQLAQAGAGVA